MLKNRDRLSVRVRVRDVIPAGIGQLALKNADHDVF